MDGGKVKVGSFFLFIFQIKELDKIGNLYLPWLLGNTFLTLFDLYLSL